jgi:hypothetical protein
LNLRASIIGAAVVIAAGVVVGAVVGGKTTTVTTTLTATVIRTVAAAGPGTSSTPTSTPTTNSPTTTTAQGTGTAGSSFPQYLSNIANPNKANFSAVDQSSPVTVNGETFTNTVSLQDPQSSSCALATISFPVPPGAKTLSGSYGWTADSDSASSEELLVYLDSTSGTPVWKRLFGSPGDAPLYKQLTVAGASEVIYQLAATSCMGLSTMSNTFILGDARFNG